MGLTLDTGAVIAIEAARRRKASASHVAFVRALSEADVIVTVPAVVLAEWWRGRAGQPWTDIAEESGYEIEEFDRAMAKAVGRLLQKVVDRERENERLLLVDAAVVVGAAERNDIIYTVDGTDIAMLATLHGYDAKRVKTL